MMAGCEVGKYAGIFWRGNTGSQASRKKCPVLKKVYLSRQKIANVIFFCILQQSFLINWSYENHEIVQ